MKENLALFDLDGTLFDTRDVNYYAYKEALSTFGVKLDKEYFLQMCNGRYYTEFLPLIMGDKGTKENIEVVHIAKKDTYVKNLDKARENKHLFTIIKSMNEIYHLAVVTTASKKNAIDILKYFGYLDLFEIIITQEDITKIKPNPQGFLMAMDKFGIDAKHTVIFEDSKVGIQAAKASGASVMITGQF